MERKKQKPKAAAKKVAKKKSSAKVKKAIKNPLQFAKTYGREGKVKEILEPTDMDACRAAIQQIEATFSNGGELILTEEQKVAFDSAEFGHDNVLIMGKPGVGKTVLTKALLKQGNKDWKVGAPTGLAALNANGKTLHSMFSLPASQGAIAPDYNVFNLQPATENYIRYQLKYLIIDEISMVRADMFDYIDRLIQYVKRVPDLPFGGIQLIMVGDFFQLPPVVVDNEKLQLREYGYSSPFIFSSRVFLNYRERFKIVLLNTVLRQIGDPGFISLLNSARDGMLNAKQLAQLNKQVGKPNDIRIKLCGTNKQADEINFNELNVLPPPSRTFTGNKYGYWKELPVEEQLELKVGAQVIVKKNRADMPQDYDFRASGPFYSKVVNGTLGVVVDLGLKEQPKPSVEDEDGLINVFKNKMEENHEHHLKIARGVDNRPIQKETEKVTIKLDNGDLVNIYRARWERKVKRKMDDGTWEEEVEASYEQMPLKLAWAISMHKSQGQSFDKVHINFKKIFAPGQAYVALSRCRTLAGVSLEEETSVKAFYADKAVLDFYKREGLD
jgi:ATP-dependent DNA helicase PIF1